VALPRRSNYWVSVVDNAERVCHVCQSWAKRTLTALHRRNLIKLIFP
jgi:hypothetical protein